VRYVLALLAAFICAQVQAQAVWHTADQQLSTVSSSGGADSRTVDAPANLAEGNLVVLVGFSESSATTATSITFPSGFTHHGFSARTDSGFGPEIAVGTKIATGSEPSSYTVDFAPTEVGRKRALAGRVTGFDASAVAGTPSIANSGGSNVVTLELSSVSVAEADSLLLVGLASRTNYADSLSISGMTVILDDDSLSLANAAAIQTVSPSSTGTRTLNWTGSDRAAALMIVINAEASASNARRRIMMTRN
jgi:hypothetical protein